MHLKQDDGGNNDLAEKKSKIEPMPYRMGLYSKISENPNLNEDIWYTRASLMQLVVNSSAEYKGK